MTEPLRILVCDDHPIVREALRARLAEMPGVELVGEAGDGLQAIHRARDLKPDVILLDVEMPVLDGIAATRRIAESLPESRVIVFTAHDKPNVGALAAESGASGYLLKSSPRAELFDAVRAVAEGGVWFSGRPRRLDRDDELARLRTLSPREREILELLAGGLRAEGVAREIGISRATVYTHVRNVVAKLGVDTRVQAVAVATRYRFIAPEVQDHRDRPGPADRPLPAGSPAPGR